MRGDQSSSASPRSSQRWIARHADRSEWVGGLAVAFTVAAAFSLVLAANGSRIIMPLVPVFGLLAGAVLAVYWVRLRRLRDVSTANLARIRESEERLAGIIRSSMEAIITVDGDQRILLFNPMAESLFRCNAGDAIGRRLGEFIPLRYRDAHEEHVRRFGITGVSERQMGRQRALYALRSDGTEFPIEASISQTVDRGGKLYTVMLRDITERVRAEQALRQSREELQQLSDSVLTAREEEKRRIARELHDDLGQRLSALKMDLAMLGADLEEGGAPQAALRQVGAMHQVIDETVASVRRIASDLRPALLDELGPAAALSWLGKNTAERYGISVSVSASEDIDLAERAAVAVFRIVQEALNNVVRHSRASDVEIRFEAVDGQYELVVQDNGIGWDGRTTPSAEGRSMGLVGVRERARLLGGAATMEYRPGGGFRLVVRFPQPDLMPSGGKP